MFPIGAHELTHSIFYSGGSQVLTNAMQKYIEKRGRESNTPTLTLNSRVSKVSLADPTQGAKSKMNVEIVRAKTSNNTSTSSSAVGAGTTIGTKNLSGSTNTAGPEYTTTTESYDHVIAAVPLPTLRYSIDISECQLAPMQFNALRQLEVSTYSSPFFFCSYKTSTVHPRRQDWHQVP
jgi:hypothetical protein